MFLGLNVVAIYSNYYSIFWAVTVFINVIISSISSIIGNSVASNDVDKNYDDMMKLNFIYLWISGVSTVCLLCLYQPFMKLWLGEKYMLDFLSVILFCVYFYSLKIGDIRQSYFEASGLWYEGKYIPLLQTLVNIILNYVLGKKYEINGIIIATIISILFIDFVFYTKILFKYYFKNKNIKEYLLSQFKYALVTLIISVISLKLCLLITLNSYLIIIFRLIICMLISNGLYVLLYRKDIYFIEVKKYLKKICQNVSKKI